LICYPGSDSENEEREKYDGPVLLTPFSIESALCFHILRGKGVRVAGFCDNDPRLRGKAYGGGCIRGPEAFSSEIPGATAIVCSDKHFEALREQLSSLGVRDIRRAEGFGKRTLSEAVKRFDRDAFRETGSGQAADFGILPWIANRLTLPAFAKNESAIVLPIADVIVTEKCSLRCEKCANLMQYFENPKHMPLARVKDDTDRLFANADYVRSLYLFGGESFLYKDLPAAMYYAERHKKQYGRQAFITNGTVVPNEETMLALRDTEALVNISDYGEHSKNMGKLTKRLTEYGVPFLVNAVKWYDYQQVTDGCGRDARAVFASCKETCVSIRAGKLYRCPFLVHGDTLRVFPHDEGNYVALDREGKSKAALRDYLRGENAPPGCAFCSGYDVGHMEKIPAAVQAARPLPYQKYG
jgi:organic radical activating enzyme